MPVYVYETVPQSKDEEPVRFEIFQSIHGDPLKAHPKTGVPVRRIIIGGLSIPKHSGTRQVATGGDCCGTC